MKPIRILHVVVSMNAGGIESMLMNLYRNIDRDKVQFDFLLHISEPTFFEEKIIRLGGKIHRVSPLKLTNLSSYQKELNLFFKNNNYRIVHSHISVWSYFVLKAAKNNNIPIRIAHSHEAHDSIWDHRLYRIPLILILKQVINKPLTNRFACATKAGKWLYGKKSFTVLNNAVDAGKFIYSEEKSNEIRANLGLQGKIVFGNVGRFNTQKNHTFLIEVFEGIHKKLPNSHLLLIGDGNLRPTIEALVKTKGIENSVSFLGVRKNVSELLSAIDYILMPSLFEGLPVSLVEAQASGLRIFASNKISDETNITNNMYFLSINDKEIWIDCILQNLEYKREDTFSEIEKAGYDVKANAQFLTEFYINEFKKINNQ